jgi:succinate-semialdehyde dehydrogenase/glutarate-semialdehyde dehydrogenase
MPFVATNPYSEETLSRHDVMGSAEIDAALERAVGGYRLWRSTDVKERAQLMVRAAELLEGEIPVIAHLMTSEMGKTFAAAKGEAAKCAATLRYFSEHAAGMLENDVISTNAAHSGVRYESVGPLLAIMPWNFPLWQVIRFAAPTMMAGNAVVLKHAPNVPGCALFLTDLFARAGFAPGVFTNLFVEPDQIPAIIADDRIVGVTLTGSERAGRAVAEEAGRSLKKCVLELGGSDAFVVAASADMDRTVANAVTARIQNNGQACIAAKRFIVVRERSDEFIERFVDEMRKVTTGDPMDPATNLGPLVSKTQLDLLAEQVSSSVAQGAVARVGGKPLEGTGYFYPATVLTDVPAHTRAANEELFGPVAVVQVANDLKHAIELGNDTPWGLAASIWASDRHEIDEGIANLDAGMVFANAIVASMPELPFGGTKRSGFGRELSKMGTREFTNAKSFYIA